MASEKLPTKEEQQNALAALGKELEQQERAESTESTEKALGLGASTVEAEVAVVESEPQTGEVTAIDIDDAGSTVSETTTDESDENSAEAPEASEEGELSAEELVNEWAEAIGRQFSKINSEARRLAEKESISVEAAKKKVIAKEYAVPEDELTDELLNTYRKAAGEWREAKAKELADQLRQDPSIVAAIETEISRDQKSFKGDPKRWSKPRATAQALQNTGLIGENSPAGTFDNGFAVRVLAQAKAENAQDSKAARLEQRQTRTPNQASEPAKVETPKTIKKEKLTPENLLDGVDVARWGELLYDIDSKVREAEAVNGDKKFSNNEKQRQRLEALKQMGMLTPEREQELLGDLKLVDSGFGKAYAQWNQYKADNPDRFHPRDESITDLRAKIAASQQKIGALFDKNDPKRWQYLADIREAEEKIAAIEAAETPNQKSKSLSIEKSTLEAELAKVDATNPNDPKRWELLANIRNIEESLDEIEQVKFDTAYNDAAGKLGIDTVANEREGLGVKKAKLQEELAQIDAANPNDPERWRVLGEIRAVEAEIAAHNEANQGPETDEAKQTRLTGELQELQQKLAQIDAANPNDPERWRVLADIREKEQEIAALDAVNEPGQGEYEALYASLKEEYDGMTPEQKNSPEGKQLRERMSDAHSRMLEADPDLTEKKTDAEIRAEVSPEKLERLQNALKAYAEARANNERREERFTIFRRFGREGMEKKLREAAAELREAKLAIEDYVVERKAALGLYEGDEAAVKAAKSDELFEGLLSLDEETRAATLALHEERAENRNKFQKGLVAIGAWLQRGKKVTRVGKQLGTGAGIGVLKGGILAASGATIPVSAVVGATIGGTLLGAVRYGANKHELDQSRAAEVGEDGKISRGFNSEQIAALKENLANSTRSYYENATALAENVLQASENYSKERIAEARKKAAKVMGVVGAGMALGGITTFGLARFHDGFHLGWPGGTDTPSPTGGNAGGGAGHGTEVLSQTDPHDVDARSKLLYPEHHLKGNSFFVEPGNGPIKEIQQAARANGHPISMGRAESIYNHEYAKFGDKLVTGGPEYHGPNGDLRFGESGKYRWGKGVLEDIVEMAAK